MGKTNFTFVSPLRAALLMLVTFGLAGFNTVMAQCAAVPNVTITQATTSTISVEVTSGEADPNHTFHITLFKDFDGNPLTNDFQFYSERIGVAGGAGVIYTFGDNVNEAPLPCNSRYRVRVREYCDDMSGNSGWHPFPGVSFNGHHTGAGPNPPFRGVEVYTYSAMFQPGPYITQTQAQLPTCPGACDGSATLNIAADLACCANATFTATVTQNGVVIFNQAGLAPNTNYTINGVCDGAVFGPLTLVVTETSGCTLEQNPITQVVPVGAGLDTEDPLYYVVDAIGVTIASNDPDVPVFGGPTGPAIDGYSGANFDFGNITLPEGECGRQDFFWVWGYDNCATTQPPFVGFILGLGLVDATATTNVPSGVVVPPTQADVLYENVPGTPARVDVHWSAGQSTVTITGFDLNGNSTDLTLDANVIASETDLDIAIAGDNQVLIPFCDTDVDVDVYVTVTGGCTSEDIISVIQNGGGITDFFFKDGVFQGFSPTFFFPGTSTNEFFARFTGLEPGAYQYQMIYTSALGNTANVAFNFTVAQSAADQPAQINAESDSFTIPYCEDAATVFFTATVTDDCATINDAAVSAVLTPDAATMLPPINIGGLTGQNCDGVGYCKSYEIIPGIALPAGLHTLEISYGAITVTRFIDIDAADNQAPNIDIPGNLNITIPPCTASVDATFTAQITDDCDDDIDVDNLEVRVNNVLQDLSDTDLFSIVGNTLEYYPTISPASDGATVEITYEDSAGDESVATAQLNVFWTPDTQAPIVVYPSQDINVELDPCDIGGTAVVFFEVTAVDNCDGDLIPDVTVIGTGNASGTIIASPGGDTYVLIAEPGIYQVLISADDAATNNTTEDFFIVVTQDAMPIDNLGCNGDLNITLDGDCRATASPDLLLEGNFGCLTDEDFDIVVLDGDTSNGATIDGCGVFDYEITLNNDGTPFEVNGFEGPFAAGNWTTMTDMGTGVASVTFTDTELTLFVDDAGPLDGDDLDLDGLDAVAMIQMPSDGDLSFDYDYTTNDDTWDWYVIQVDGTIIASSDTDDDGSVAESVSSGDVLILGLDDDGCCFGGGFDGTLTVSNFSFSGVEFRPFDANFTTCWGTLNVEDKEDPVIVCPEDVSSYGFKSVVVESFAGELTGDDPTFNRPFGVGAACGLSGVGTNVFYDTYTFGVTEPGVYTFTGSSGPDLFASLHTSDFDPSDPCDTQLTNDDDGGPGLLPEISFDFTIALPAGEYTLVISTFANGTTGAYTIDIATPDEGGDVQAIGPADFICTDLNVLRLDLPTSNIPDSYLVDADGDIISIDDALEDILDITGYPTATDNCGDIRIFVSDVFTDGGDCGDDYITRSFYAIDKMNSPCAGPSNESLVCTQIITARKPDFNDVMYPPALVSIDCDDYAGADNPTPQQVADILNIPSGYPVVMTALDALDYDNDNRVFERGFNPLNDAYCNLGASWVDLPRINVCAGTYKFVREWTLLDWCDPGNIVTYRQVIKVGDYDGPEIDVPTADYDWDGVNDVLEYSTSPYDCYTYFPLPDAGINDVCSGAGDLTITVLVDGAPIFVGVAGDVYAPGYPIGDHVMRYCATDGCGNETCEDVPFKVRDKVAPQAVCDDDLNVSIGGGDILYGQQGIARVFAADVDEGSTDNCGQIEIQVRREVEGGPSYGCLDAFDYDGDGVVINDEVRNEGGTWYTIWLDYVDFTCCDVDVLDGNGIVIEMRVSDDANGNGVYFETGQNGDNINTCWLEVEPEDKLNPYCYPPHPVTLSCTEVPLYFPSDLQAAYNSDFAATSTMMSAVFGNAFGTDNCAVDTIVERTPSINLTDCGWGTITRRFEAWQLEPEGDVNGNGAIDGNEVRRSTNTCSQLITITEYHDYYIAFPPDAEADCGDPNIPEVVPTEIGCDILAVNVSDPERFDATGDECYKLRITHTVINWCLWNGEDDPYVIARETGGDGFVGCTENPIVHGRGTTAASVVASVDRAHPCGDTQESNNNTFADRGYWEYVQFVKVYDSTIPEITVDAFGGPTEECPDLLPGQFGSINNVTCDAPVSITFTVDDDCELFDSEGNLVISLVDAHLDRFAFDANGDGEISTFSEFVPDVNVAGNITNNGDGTFTFNYVAPIIFSSQGPNIIHALRVRVEDGCGNQTSETIEFDVVDCKAPTPICINGLTVTLMPQQDGPCAMAIWASDFLASPITDCAEPIRYAIYRAADVEAAGPGFVPNQNDTGLVLTEADDPTTIVYIYAIDAEGNFDYCETYLLVQAHNSCVPTGGGSIAGIITTEEDEPVQDVEVNLSGAMVMTQVTETDGAFEFEPLDAGMDYTVTPYLDANPLNGVSTFDLVLMSKHILGVDLLDSPYKMIAADVNNSQTITTLDLIQLRKLILNIDLEFSNNTSWRFVATEYVFPVPTNPWFEPFQEIHNENNLPVDAEENADFYAVKIGDVNGSAAANLLSSDDRNVNGQFNFNVADVDLKAGNEYTVEFTGADMASVAGYQLTIALEGADLVDVVYGVATEENFGMRFVNEGMITTSWNGEATADDVLFSLVVRANADAQLSEVLGVSSRYTVAEAYNNNNDLLNVGIQFNTGVVANAGFEVYQNTPNPFKGETLIGFNLPEDAQASITINDVTGRTVTVIRGDYAAGYNTVNVTREMLSGATGVLSYTVTAGDFTATKKMIVVE